MRLTEALQLAGAGNAPFGMLKDVRSPLFATELLRVCTSPSILHQVNAIDVTITTKLGSLTNPDSRRTPTDVHLCRTEEMHLVGAS
jgi:hypothetical protein